jgi:hypothetical protein
MPMRQLKKSTTNIKTRAPLSTLRVNANAADDGTQKNMERKEQRMKVKLYFYPTHTRALRNMRSHGLSSFQEVGCQEN